MCNYVPWWLKKKQKPDKMIDRTIVCLHCHENVKGSPCSIYIQHHI